MLRRWMERPEPHTLYLFDVRSPEEFHAGHIAGFRSAPGGQLIQATDEFLAVRGARVVLADSDRVRAVMTASWLIQMGWDAYALQGGAKDFPHEHGDPPPLLGDPAGVNWISPAEAHRLTEQGAAGVADLSSSRSFRRGHIPGAWFLMRSRFGADLGLLPRHGPLLLTSEDGLLAGFAAEEAQALWPHPVRVLQGGNRAWQEAGLPLEAGDGRMASPAADVYPKPYERGEGAAAAMRDYLAWELALLDQIGRDDEVEFRFFPPA